MMTNSELNEILDQRERQMRAMYPNDFASDWISKNLQPLKEQLLKEGRSGSLEQSILKIEIPEPLDEGEEASGSYIDQDPDL